MVENPNIWDIMCLINNNCSYVGTSLHDVVTVTSFSIPMVTHRKIKARQYLTDWEAFYSSQQFRRRYN